MGEKAKRKKDPDIEINARAKATELRVQQAGKVEFSTYSKTRAVKFHHTRRDNIDEEIKDGDVYTDLEIEMVHEVSLDSSKKDEEI